MIINQFIVLFKAINSYNNQTRENYPVPKYPIQLIVEIQKQLPGFRLIVSFETSFSLVGEEFKIIFY